MNQVEKKLMDEFANTTLQSALQSAFQHSDCALNVAAEIKTKVVPKEALL